MPAITVKSNTDVTLTLNGTYAGFIKRGETLSLPIGNKTSVISAMPISEKYFPCSCLIESGSILHLVSSSSSLFKWSDEIYELELELVPYPCALPPIITCEENWGNGYAGICGGFFVFEDKFGKRSFFPETVDSFSVLSDRFAVIEKDSLLAVIGNDMSIKFPFTEAAIYNKEGNSLIIRFSPGEMDCFEVCQRFSLENMHLISSSVSKADADTPFNTIRCFCQAVRLKLESTAMDFLVPDIGMSFDDIFNFLGVFDRTESVKFISAGENAVALRYKLDDCNYHYMCYEFTFSDNGKIYDITQI